eukprot:TRINITY_DN43732_c0_g1_i1.p1 TRINITY_DN43732_c0_g1~~TRINITY_DN43732_c0_g1_i1.p1  ORF type:complete len:306 (+),score=82.80 TRINITY_DN43732_c0_g1_i1:63-920(+)
MDAVCEHSVVAEDWVIDFDDDGAPSPMCIHTTPPGVVEADAPKTRKLDIPAVPGLTVIEGLLTQAECDRIVRTADDMGFARRRQAGPLMEQRVAASRDVPGPPSVTAVGTQEGSLRQNGVVEWVVAAADSEAVFKRAERHLPSAEGIRPVGLNSYWRIYKYTPGDTFLPHYDGSWLGAGLTESGELMHDAYGDRASLCSLVVYLREDFEGGATRFFIPQGEEEEELYADVEVKPGRTGSALLFWHSPHPLSPLHEGATVTSGVKYVIRTDVLYPLSVVRHGKGTE